MNEINKWFDENSSDVWKIAEFIFENPELSLEEKKSSRCLANFMEDQGFSIEWKVAGLETAFVATWGAGKPVLGFLAEYDALPGLGQKPVDRRSEIEGCGHGCGHSVLGVGAAAAAVALKKELELSGKSGTIKLFGCPAEEIMYGKIIMTEQGCFDDLDAAITWHPSDVNRVGEDIYQAMDCKKFRFFGVTSHASGSPHLGRSALDAAELMNVGVNYLREHVTDDVRIHYTYLDAGVKPNIVPDFAQTSYYIRGNSRKHVDDASQRIERIAQGAALMTDTRYESELVSNCKETKLNFTLLDTFYEAMTEVPVPKYTEEEIQFAKSISEAANLDNEGKYFDGLQKYERRAKDIYISTDVSNVSHKVPTVTLNAATACKGTPLHHWAFTAQTGSTIGFKSMIYVAKCMALGGLKLIDNPEILAKAIDEHLNI
ncbi:amidohydrolase [Clostridium sp. HBUAS56017]|uniref:amidohydrolase n=1 Tax=Clostridium sp. HBUAS56017 TaxID=2571128 RepID=UPI001178CC0C|nr:amidohydrolase [Clostridium sp. HBUAS56017]